MESDILAKIRQIKEIVKREDIVSNDKMSEFPFQPLIRVLGQILNANAYLVSEIGELLGFYSTFDFINSERTNQMLANHQLDETYMHGLAAINQTIDNIAIDDDRTIFATEYRQQFSEGKTAIIPIFAADIKIGYLILARPDAQFNVDDMILAEYIASLLALEMEHLNRDRQSEQSRRQHLVELAVNSLSYSELMALRTIFDGQTEPVFRITASKIAEEVGITRSVIVNALRKLESAGVIQSRSLGMKGTHININDEHTLTLLQHQLHL
ncbi:HTH domain-containing protein [Aerococcus suis]|uniref:Global transcriptional regulator CodY n=1 Tax=Aerococcus suis TaxID=371602 RepID=A0A1W1Y8D7_9LACT|nr:HTH domain-containing protein [Aerococcus suis]MDD7758446.1 helix-turn-helix domain-containing protein [Aerococcus suis]MDY4647040.1 helix-turn-helix domain-containing protein [Aerococcus suis]SMC32409.1 transcriptional pleiotropic repressor [Aerococcus suis]